MPERCTVKYNPLHLYGNQDSLPTESIIAFCFNILTLDLLLLWASSQMSLR